MNLIPFGAKNNDKKEPPMERKTTPAPAPQPVSPEVQAFIDMSTRQREDLQHYQSRCQQLENELKLTSERLRSTEIELRSVKDDKDFLMRHDSSMLTGLHDIKVLIIATEERARANAVAPAAPPRGNEGALDLDEAVAEINEQARRAEPPPVEPPPIGMRESHTPGDPLPDAKIPGFLKDGPRNQ
jgi:hypothetical protein